MPDSETIPDLSSARSEAKPCPEMHNIVTDANLTVVQVTTDAESEGHSPEMLNVPVSYSADGRRMVFCRKRHVFAGKPRLEVTLCLIDRGWALLPLTCEEGVGGYALTPDGRYLYYVVDETTRQQAGRVLLKRVDLEQGRRETLMVLDGPVPGVGRPPRGGFMVGEASLSRDGRKLATSAPFCTDDESLHACLVFELDTLRVRAFVFDPGGWRPVGHYCQHPAHADEMLIFDDHVYAGFDNAGQWFSRPRDVGASRTYHVVRDDGTLLASCPVGRVPGEGGPNHAIWRGARYEVACHMSLFNTAPHWRGGLILCEPLACAPADRDRGAAIPGARRWELTRHIRRPDCFHMAFDPSGTRMVSDTEGVHGVGETSLLYIGTIADVRDPFLLPRYVLHPNSSQHSYSTQPKPSLTPDGRWLFFRSDWLGKREHPQLFVAGGFTFP